MLFNVLLILLGFLFLVWGADRFVVGASATANNLGVSPLLIGLTIVGFGTSAPEILVSANASFNGHPTLAVGNAIGSNIANIGLILGITAVIMPLTVRSRTLRRELPVLLAVTLLTLLPFLNHQLDRLDGVLLLAGLGLMMYWLIKVEVRTRGTDPMYLEYEAEIPRNMSMRAAIAWLFIGLIVLVIASRVLVINAVEIARTLGVSDLVIGLTIVAIGTSLPELAASLTAAVKKEYDLVLGNIIGSNMYNLLAVIGVAAVIQPTEIEPQILTRDFVVMIGLTIFVFATTFDFSGQEGRITRWEGLLLLLVFVGYQMYLIRQSVLI